MVNALDNGIIKNEGLELVDGVLGKTISVMEDGRDEVFKISENARVDLQQREEELVRTQTMINLVIAEIDELEKAEKEGRNLYLAVAKDPDKFSKREIQEIYAEASKLNIHLALKRDHEKNLIMKRTTLEFHIRNAKDVLARSNVLIGKIGMALEYLTGSLLDEIAEVKISRNVGLQIIRFQEDERNRISRDIHDGPAQSMANAVMQVELCEKLLDKDPKRAKLELSRLKTQIRSTISDLRRIIFGLMPMSLEDLGLIATTLYYLEEEKRKHSINIRFEHTNIKDVKLDSLVSLSMFRIIQECLGNVIKHSGAKNCAIKLLIEREFLKLDIVDDGSGFVPNPRNLIKTNSGFGIYGMKERVRLLRGVFTLKSTTEGIKGTHISITIPLE